MKLYDYHDYEIIEYKVNVIERTIMINLKSDSEDMILTFTNVTVHKFNNVRQQNVLDYIEEKNPESFVIDNEENLGALSQISWPVYFKSKEELTVTLKNLNQHYFKITAILGLNGFILAETMEENIHEQKRASLR